jgi:hypothetical protein
MGDDLVTGRIGKIAGILHVNGNHWIAYCLDGKNWELRVGDSFDEPLEYTIATMFTWWPSHHSGKGATVQENGRNEAR